jgi:hypothetical protein
MSWRDKIAAVLAGKVGGPTPTGIHVYHSSPHDFDRFDLSKIGTGEGAQVYGHGIYAAESPAVSGQGGQYWKQFLGRFGNAPEGMVAGRLKEAGFDPAPVAEKLQQDIARLQEAHDSASGMMKQRALQNLQHVQDQYALLTSGAPVGPRTYEVNFKAKPEELLDWDKPLKQQPQHLDAAYRLLPHMREAPAATGSSFYDVLSTQLRGGEFAKEGQMRASEKLGEAGIPGIRYLDEGSRISSPEQIKAIRENIAHREALLADRPNDPTNTKWLAEYRDMLQRAENPTHNYVAFDPSRLDIMAKYGVVGATGGVLGAGAMGGTIDQSSYGARQ